MKRRLLYFLLPRGPFNLRTIIMYLLTLFSLIFLITFTKMAYQSLYLSQKGEVTSGTIIDVIEERGARTFYLATIQFTDMNDETQLTSPLALSDEFVERYDQDPQLMMMLPVKIIYNPRYPKSAELLNVQHALYPLKFLFYFLISTWGAIYFGRNRTVGDQSMQKALNKPNIYYDPNKKN